MLVQPQTENRSQMTNTTTVKRKVSKVLIFESVHQLINFPERQGAIFDAEDGRVGDEG